MLVGQVCHLTATGRTLEETLLYEERLVDVLYGSGILAKGGGYGPKSYGTALELIYYGRQDAVIDLIQTVFVNIKRLQSYIGNGECNAARSLDLRKVTHAAQQGIGYTGGSAASARYLGCGISITRYTQYSGGTEYDFLQGLGILCRIWRAEVR